MVGGGRDIRKERRMTKFIVDEKTIWKAVEFGLKESINDSKIVDRLIRPIINELEIVLWDDCEIYEEGKEE